VRAYEELVVKRRTEEARQSAPGLPAAQFIAENLTKPVASVRRRAAAAHGLVRHWRPYR
jgi:hypothetical protein